MSLKVKIENKHILYIGPIYFQYDQYLIKKLKQLGAHVDAFELFLNTRKFKLIRKFSPLKAIEYKDKFFNRVFLNKKQHYDYILVRHGHELSAEYFQKLKSLNPNAKFINFHWDSLKPRYDYLHIIDSFDKVYSFDPKDCQEHEKINYLPLFYLDEYAQCINKSKNDIDLLFIGAWRDQERVDLITETNNLCRKLDLSFYYYLFLSLEEQLNFIKKGEIAKYSKSKSLSHHQILQFFSKSNTIIDFPSSFQSGLTIRTFEALGAGKKLITTNKNIAKEPFYNPEFIDIIDAKKLHLNKDFIREIPKICIKDRMAGYSLESYIEKLIA